MNRFGLAATASYARELRASGVVVYAVEIVPLEAKWKEVVVTTKVTRRKNEQ